MSRFTPRGYTLSSMHESVDQLITSAGQYHAAGRLREAEDAYRAAVARDPQRLDASAGLGVLLSQLGAHEEALRLLPHELVFRTGLPLLLVARGSSLLATAKADDAIACLQRAVQIDGHSHEAHNTLGCALLAQKRYLEAITALHRAVEIYPSYPEAYFNLGLTLYAAGMYAEAADMYRRAAQFRSYPQALLNRGFALRKTGDLDAAIASFHEALALSPTFDQAMHNLGATLADTGKAHEGIQWIRRAIATNPANHHAHSALIYLQNFDPQATPEEMALEQQRWHERHAGTAGILPASPRSIRSTGFSLPTSHPRQNSEANDPNSHLVTLSPPHLVTPSPTHPLRLAYVSPDFRAHAEARFLLPLFQNHNRQHFEIHLYSTVESPDDYTAQFQKIADHWHDVPHLSDEQLAAQIRNDQIDILIDLTMHMAHNRLLTFARKPAPVQITWLAYPGTTGLRAIQYHITDSHLEPLVPPPSQSDPLPQRDETARSTGFSLPSLPLRLPDSWFCYQPDTTAPPVNPLPALSSSNITFGSLNTFRKMSPQVVTLWADTLRAVANAQPKTPRLILSCPEGSHRAELLATFESRGIPPTQIELLPPMPYAQYLATNHRIDIALDPFPHNGATTTLDALYMGVPVLSLKGMTPAGRLGESILTTAGLGEWLAHSPDDFVLRAAAHARDVEGLARLRGELRERLMASTMTDGVRFTRNFEAAIAALWKK